MIKLNNFGIFTPVAIEKATNTDRVLMYTRNSDKLGEVQEGVTTVDYMVQDEERGITLHSTAASNYTKLA